MSECVSECVVDLVEVMRWMCMYGFPCDGDGDGVAVLVVQVVMSMVMVWRC